MSDPIPVIPLEYAAPIEPRAGRSMGRVLVAAWVIALIAWVLVLVQVETVLGSGPVLCVLGLIIAMMGWRRRRPWVAAIGAGHCAICALFVGLVVHFSWNPDNARAPFAMLGGAYVIATAVPTFLVFRQSRQRS